jgi:hypothetical protein
MKRSAEIVFGLVCWTIASFIPMMYAYLSQHGAEWIKHNDCAALSFTSWCLGGMLGVAGLILIYKGESSD